MVIKEDDGTGTHFPLWDAEVLCQVPEVLCQAPEVLCQVPEVLCQVRDVDEEDNGTGTHFPFALPCHPLLIMMLTRM